MMETHKFLYQQDTTYILRNKYQQENRIKLINSNFMYFIYPAVPKVKIKKSGKTHLTN